MAKGATNILEYTDTDNKGHYQLTFTSEADSVVVIVGGLSIGNQVKVVPTCNQQLNFRVEEHLKTLHSIPEQESENKIKS